METYCNLMMALAILKQMIIVVDMGVVKRSIPTPSGSSRGLKTRMVLKFTREIYVAIDTTQPLWLSGMTALLVSA